MVLGAGAFHGTQPKEQSEASLGLARATGAALLKLQLLTKCCSRLLAPGFVLTTAEWIEAPSL
eukprot:4980197-Amphidinium_carterae.1